MTNEEIGKEYLKCEEHYYCNKEIERLTNELNQCMIDHNKLLDRIDKAIEYIKEIPTCEMVDDEYLKIFDIKFNEKLLNILQGVDKE